VPNAFDFAIRHRVVLSPGERVGRRRVS
jgi:hypothetical protein